jgi:hypothetical protein
VNNRQCTSKEKKNKLDLVATFCLLIEKLPFNFALLGGNGNTKDGIKIKGQKNIDRDGPKPIPEVCRLSYPP